MMNCLTLCRKLRLPLLHRAPGPISREKTQMVKKDIHRHMNAPTRFYILNDGSGNELFFARGASKKEGILFGD